MSYAKMSAGDRMFQDAIYNHVHENVSGVRIDRDLDSRIVRIEFIIENTDRTKMVKDFQYIRNEEIKYYRPENIAFRANKFAHLIDEVPDYIPEEQTGLWLELRLEKL